MTSERWLILKTLTWFQDIQAEVTEAFDALREENTTLGFDAFLLQEEVDIACAARDEVATSYQELLASLPKCYQCERLATHEDQGDFGACWACDDHHGGEKTKVIIELDWAKHARKTLTVDG